VREGVTVKESRTRVNRTIFEDLDAKVTAHPTPHLKLRDLDASQKLGGVVAMSLPNPFGTVD